MKAGAFREIPSGGPVAFGATFFSITGLHLLHVISGVIALIVVGIGFQVGKLDDNYVETTGLYWHFVDLVWMFVFPLLISHECCEIDGKGSNERDGSNHDPKTGFYVGVWIVLLCISGLEVFLTYRGLSTHALLASLLLLAVIESAIGVLYFMHLKFERRVMMWSILLSIVFVLLMMNQIWPDAYRMTTIRLH